MNLSKGQQAIMKTNGHLLVTGGPGSGKTTISILKAEQIARQYLKAGQKILFLSFARATVFRVLEAIEHEQKVPTAQKRLIDVETYHAFFWRILKTHGYLAGLPRRLNILAPPMEAVALSEVRSSQKGTPIKDIEVEEQVRLAKDEGRVCFDLFASYVSEILHGSERIRSLVAAMYPVIIFDEFQDTNKAQWSIIQALGQFCRLIVLADPEQRIYDWLGADPARLNQFRAVFAPEEVDLSTDNHRSTGTEITKFGNDILTGISHQNSYNGVKIDYFEPNHNRAMTKLVTVIYAARSRLIQQNVNSWSLAVLVPTKKMTRMVSEFLRNPLAGLTAIPHSAIIEMEGVILAAEIVAFLMQSNLNTNHHELFINLVCNYFRGKNGGEQPTQVALKTAKSYAEQHKQLREGTAIRNNSILMKTIAVFQQTQQYKRTGNPDHDWLAILQILEGSACAQLKEIAKDARNVRLLGRGTVLRQEFTQDWRDNGGYHNSLVIMRQMFIQEHFSASTKPESGVIVMNMHKAKGKQFDEVIIFEGWPRRKNGQIVYNGDRIVRSNVRDQINDQARQNLRVSVTRSKLHTTILTPRCDPCILLP